MKNSKLILILILSIITPKTAFGVELLDPNYNENVRPNDGKQTDNVDIGLFINSIRSVSEMDMSITIDAFVQGSWVDDRLLETYQKLFTASHGTTPEFCSGPYCSNYRATLGSKFGEKIWKPDFYFSGATSIEPTDDYNDNVCIRLDNNGRVFWSQRFLIKISCPMRLTYFPFDQHTCPIAIGSYKYHDGLVNLTFSEKLSGMYSGQETSNFLILDFDARRDRMRITAAYMDDYFSEQWILLNLSRKYGLFFSQLFLPSLSLTVLGWVTFWINPRCLPERATISITVILAQVVLIFGVAAQYPSVSDLKMADIYVIMNFVFNVGGLVENILATHFWVKNDDEFLQLGG